MKKLLVLHGPNLALLGIREPHIYGQTTLEMINKQLTERATHNNLTLETFQSNHEGELIDRIHKAYVDKITHIIINPAGLTHTSIALRDALLSVSIPFIEVHLSNIYKREPFRHHSYFSDCAEGVISGFGTSSYLLAFDAIINLPE